MKITKSKLPPIIKLGYSLRNILDGLIGILTLGFYSSQTTLDYVIKYHKKQKKDLKTQATK